MKINDEVSVGAQPSEEQLEVANAYSPFFRVTSLFTDPSLYGRHVVLGFAVLLVLIWTGRINVYLAAALAALFFGGHHLPFGGTLASFDAAADFYENRAAVQVGMNWGYVDSTGAEVIAHPPARARPALRAGQGRGELHQHERRSGRVQAPGAAGQALRRDHHQRREAPCARRGTPVRDEPAQDDRRLGGNRIACMAAKPRRTSGGAFVYISFR